MLTNTKKEVIKLFLQSKMFKRWHWFQYHFQGYKFGFEHPFAKSIVESISNIYTIDKKSANKIITRISSVSGSNMNLAHYEQLIQICAELYVTNQIITYFEGKDIDIKFEPHTGESRKNPELTFKVNKYTIGVEVKAPSIISHANTRSVNPSQISTRVEGLLDSVVEIFGRQVTLPRDNVVKDFLISADEKFEKFKKNNPYFVGVLFIVWDDFIYEPISALIGKPSGLFTEGSFARDKSGSPILFNNIDAVIIDRHLMNIFKASRDENLLYDKKHAMDYGNANDFPFKVAVPAECIKKLPLELVKCFQVVPLSDELGAEYMPSDLITWYL